MNQVELLRHVADNLEAGRDAWHGLTRGANKPGDIIARDIGFNPSYLCSLAPPTHIINGVEVPAPMDKEPEQWSVYWVEKPCDERCADICYWAGDNDDIMRFARGICYSSMEAAAANCRARYGLK